MDYYSSLNANTLDLNIPTLFELISAKQLNSLLSPSLRFILVHYAQRNPRYLLRLVNKFDELYLLLFGLVEYYHLKNYNATFTEKFYGLKRSQKISLDNPIRTSADPGAERLLAKETRLSYRKQVLGSVVTACIVPYINEKLTAYYDVLQSKNMLVPIERATENILADTSASKVDKLKARLRLLFYRVFPTVKALLSWINLLLQILYLFNKSPMHSLEYWILGIRPTRIIPEAPSEDADARSKARAREIGAKILGLPLKRYENHPMSTSEALRTFLLDKVILPAHGVSLSTLSYVFPAAIFSLKFLEWWYASEFSSTLSKKARNAIDVVLPVPPALPVLTQNGEPEQKRAPSDICRLCANEISNAAIIETGYVFCYPCIHNFLAEGKSEGRCPVTGQRLLGCRYNELKESWEVSGIRKLMV